MSQAPEVLAMIMYHRGFRLRRCALTMTSYPHHPISAVRLHHISFCLTQGLSFSSVQAKSVGSKSSAQRNDLDSVPPIVRTPVINGPHSPCYVPSISISQDYLKNVKYQTFRSINSLEE